MAAATPTPQATFWRPYRAHVPTPPSGEKTSAFQQPAATMESEPATSPTAMYAAPWRGPHTWNPHVAAASVPTAGNGSAVSFPHMTLVQGPHRAMSTSPLPTGHSSAVLSPMASSTSTQWAKRFWRATDFKSDRTLFPERLIAHHLIPQLARQGDTHCEIEGRLGTLVATDTNERYRPNMVMMQPLPSTMWEYDVPPPHGQGTGQRRHPPATPRVTHAPTTKFVPGIPSREFVALQEWLDSKCSTLCTPPISPFRRMTMALPSTGTTGTIDPPGSPLTLLRGPVHLAPTKDFLCPLPELDGTFPPGTLFRVSVPSHTLELKLEDILIVHKYPVWKADVSTSPLVDCTAYDVRLSLNCEVPVTYPGTVKQLQTSVLQRWTTVRTKTRTSYWVGRLWRIDMTVTQEETKTPSGTRAQTTYEVEVEWYHPEEDLPDFTKDALHVETASTFVPKWIPCLMKRPPSPAIVHPPTSPHRSSSASMQHRTHAQTTAPTHPSIDSCIPNVRDWYGILTTLARKSKDS